MSFPPDQYAGTLQEVTQVAVIRQPQHGVLLLHSPSRRWHFPDATVHVQESWEQSLRRRVQADTGITDLVIRSVLRIQNFAPGVVHECAQYGVFFLCTTEASAVRPGARDDQWCWVKGREELAGRELIHPLVEELVVEALKAPMPAEPVAAAGVKGIKWVGTCAEDWDTAVAFYRDVLGLPVRSRGWLSVGQGGVRCAELGFPDGDFLEVFDANIGERDLFRAPVVGFLVEDVAAARGAMEGKGVSFIGPVYRGTGWEWSYFRSPEGHVYEIMAELKGPV
jgi:catechol 2,3-dioxygenase-like lactoylglutathione lyase family enzyme